jgi:hypothetical protein
MGTRTLLDALGAAVVGGLIVITIITGMQNIQLYSYNTKIQATLNQTSEVVVSVLQDRYLSALGVSPSSGYVPTDPTKVIKYAKKQSFRFFAEIDGKYKRVTIARGSKDATTGWWPLTAKVGNTLDMGAFWVEEKFIFSYLDENNNVLPFSGNKLSAANIQKIRAVRVELAFVLPGMVNSDGIQLNVRNKIVFWQFFKNLYL